MTARGILELLRVKHNEDLFVAECKDGPTQGASHMRLDAWALKRSWANPCSFGYEIKISRSDWLRDDKLNAYLPLCHRFYLVCPAGLIQPAEIPAGAGLLWVSSTGSRFYTKRKAVHRDIAWPIYLLLYVLFCRVTVTPEYKPQDNAEYWRDWLAKRAEDREIGYRVRRELRDHVDRVERERDSAVARYQSVVEAEQKLKDLGLDYLLQWTAPADLRAKVMAHVSREVAELSEMLTGLVGTADKTRKAIDEAITTEIAAQR